MVTCYKKRTSTTCLPKVGHLCDTIILGPYDNDCVVVLIHQSASDGNSCILSSATLKELSHCILIYFGHVQNFPSTEGDLKVVVY